VKICVIGDVHSNLPALDAVLEHAGVADQFWCVGDLVGYGPYPSECVKLVSEKVTFCVAGNHDLGSIGKISLADFNPIARIACVWNGNKLDGSEKEYLKSLPLIIEHEGVRIVHGSLRDPIWEYILSGTEAMGSLSKMEEGEICFHGHSHVPAIFSLMEGKLQLFAPVVDGQFFEFSNKGRYLVNVGSVGQPRDSDPRACYVVFNPDDRTAIYHRVAYPIEVVQAKMDDEGLPGVLSARLSFGE